MINNSSAMAKLLSHRLRGFDKIELTATGLKKACESNVPYLEIDTRVSSDGKIYVYHDSSVRAKGLTHVFSKTPSSILDNIKYQTRENILSLSDALLIFKKSIPKQQRLCIDIKDYGFEKEYIELINKYDLEKNIIFVSWIPQTLLDLKRLGANTPFILSHWNVMRFGWLGGVIHRILRNKIFSIKHFVLIGGNKSTHALPSLAHGYQHTIIIQELPYELLTILSNSGGGICVHISMLNKKLACYCEKNNLKLWIFSVNNYKQYLKYGKKAAIDVIFSDNAIETLSILSRNKDTG